MKLLKKNKGKIIALITVLLLLAFSYGWGSIAPEEKTESTAKVEKSVQEEIGIKEIDAESEKTAVEKETLSKQEEPLSSALQAEVEKEPSPVENENPAPIEPQSVTITDKAYTCTISVRCDMALANINLLDEEKIPLLPKDGIILPPTEVTFYEGESVFNLLLREMKRNKIHMEYVNTPIYNSAYIEGINNLYEFDCGELSGWMYRVNGWFPSYGCSQYQLKQGDSVEWLYTCDLGRDVGKNIN